MTPSAPVLFFGHGNPMNAVTDNAYGRKWHALGRGMPRPKAILSISAHWYIEQTAVTTSAQPSTIHDFGGFPRELYEVQYAAPGDSALARRVQELLAPLTYVAPDDRWGFDHGTWSVLRHVFPDADVPVVQLSIDETKPPRFHYELARHLAPLRDQGVLVIGSGNVVHNLHTFAWGQHPVEPFDWALRFEAQVRDLILDGKHEALIDYESLGRDALLSVPTPDHFLPLVYVLALRRDDDAVTFPVEGVDGGSVSMLAVDIRATA